jgi:TM2 domain-containing membrane protein YozV
MDNQKFYMMFPGLHPEELLFIKNINKDYNETEQQQFMSIYQGKRKDPQFIMILTFFGFCGIAGLQRFMMRDMGIGILYLLTVGLCGIGTIMDLINNQSLALEHNRKAALESADLVDLMNAH